MYVQLPVRMSAQAVAHRERLGAFDWLLVPLSYLSQYGMFASPPTSYAIVCHPPDHYSVNLTSTPVEK